MQLQIMQNSNLKRWQSIIAFLLVAIIFGSLPPVIKQVEISLSPSVQLAVRYLIGLFFLLPWIARIISKIELVQTWKNSLSLLINSSKSDHQDLSNEIVSINLASNLTLLRDGFILGLLTFGIHISLAFGVQIISANRTSFLLGLCVIFVTILDLVYRRRFSWRVFLAIILAFSGSGLMFWEQSSEPLIGTLWILGAVTCEAIMLTILEDVSKFHSALNLSLLRLGVASVLALSIGIIELPSQLAAIQANWESLLYLGGATATTTWLIVFALQTLPAVEAALIQGLEPIFGAVISFILLGEVLGVRGLIGSGLILIGTIMTILTPAIESTKAEANLSLEKSKLEI